MSGFVVNGTDNYRQIFFSSNFIERPEVGVFKPDERWMIGNNSSLERLLYCLIKKFGRRTIPVPGYKKRTQHFLPAWFFGVGVGHEFNRDPFFIPNGGNFCARLPIKRF